MPTLTIDKRTITVPDGTKVIKAAEDLGIMIPRFCYHPALGSVGACRMCAVGFKEGPVKGVEMSCMIEAQEGMVVASDDPEAVDFRRHVIELLMINHPHDCPVCDEGGHCLLQDTTISGGHGRRRFQGLKRTHQDQDLGPLVQHEMNRCIQCYRCSRYYQEYSGYRDLGVTGIGARVYFGRSEAGTLESPFTGNLTDICPTGVYTDKPSRFYGRRWDYERAPSVCLHCSLGCNLTVSARYRRTVRHEARRNPEINGHFICDRGRYGYAYASLDERPREARLEGRSVTVDAGLSVARDKLAELTQSTSPESIALVGSARSSLETQALLVHLSRRHGWRWPCYATDDAASATTAAAMATLTANNAASLSDLENADVVVVVGADPLGEAPMLALALRQARRKGARIVTIDPRPVALPLDHTHIPLQPGDLGTAVRHLICGALEPSREIALSADRRAWFEILKAGTRPLAQDHQLQSLGRDLTTAWRPAFVCGTAVTDPAVIQLVTVLQTVVQISCMWSGIFYLLPGANSFGAQRHHRPEAGFDALITAMETGAVKALVAVENDLFNDYGDRPRLEAALAKLDLLVVLDCLDTAVGRAADLFLPTQTLYEAGGRYLNNEGRLQRAQAVIAGGSAIHETGQGDHPPREFDAEIPGGAPQAAWRLLCRLCSADGARGDAEDILTEALAADGQVDLLEAGGRISLPAAVKELTDTPPPEDAAPAQADGPVLIESATTFGSEILSAASPVLAELTADPRVTVHPDTAAALNWRAGEHIEIPGAAPTQRLEVVVDARTAQGVMVVDRRIGMDRLALRHWVEGLRYE